MDLKSSLRTGSFYFGIGTTLIIAIMAGLLAKLPYLTIIGHLVLAILLGIIWSHTIGWNRSYKVGVDFSSKKLLRLGIILLGLRLNLSDLAHAGVSTFLYAAFLLCVTLLAVYSFARMLRVDKTLSLLTACGTAICGAAAIVAIASVVRAKESVTAVSVGVIAVLGTLFTLLYTFLYPILPITDYQYGMLTGGTLHEIAHVVAASSVGGVEAENIAIIVKLTRVILLVPVAILIGYYMKKRESQESATKNKLPIPWFIFGFLAMSAINTLGWLPTELVQWLISGSYLLLAMAMAGLGLNVELSAFKKMGLQIFYAALLGTILLVLLGFIIIFIM